VHISGRLRPIQIFTYFVYIFVMAGMFFKYLVRLITDFPLPISLTNYRLVKYFYLGHGFIQDRCHPIWSLFRDGLLVNLRVKRPIFVDIGVLAS
jgi:hypothetical protein